MVLEIVDTSGQAPRRGRPPRDTQEWLAAFLEHYSAKGNIHTAARIAGVSVNTVQKARRTNRDIDRRVRLAYREYGAMLRETLGELGIEKGNVIALLASLKAHSRKMAERYSEKAVDARVMNLTVNNTTAIVSDEAAARLLGSLMEHITPATRRLLAPAIVEGEIVP